MKKRFVYLLSCIALVAGLAACSDDKKEFKNPPSVSIELTEGSIDELPQGESVILKAKVESILEDVQIQWLINGKEVSTEATYTFVAEEIGTYEIQLKAINLDGENIATRSIQVYGKYRDGTFILNEGATWGGDKGGKLIFITPKGALIDSVFNKENNGSFLGGTPQDLFIHNNKMYLVSQDGGNEGGFLTITNAETLKLEKSYEEELKGKVDWPTHVAVLSDNEIYLRDNSGISLFNPSTKEATFIKGTDNARKNTMAVVEGKVFASKSKSLLVIEAGKDTISYNVDFDSPISGVLKSSDNNLWVSTSSGKIAKVNANDYSIIATNEIEGDAAKTLNASFAAAPSISAKGDTLYMSALATKIYRHVFSEKKTELMVDAKEFVEDANTVYNTVAVDPVTGDVILNTIKGFGEKAKTNQITVFDFSGKEPVIKKAYNNYTKYPAGVFFTANFK